MCRVCVGITPFETSLLYYASYGLSIATDSGLDSFVVFFQLGGNHVGSVTTFICNSGYNKTNDDDSV